MSGTIDVKDFKITAGIQSPSQVKISTVKSKKKAMVVKYKKASKAKKYYVRVRGFFMNGKTKVYGPYSAKKVVKIK